MTTHHQLLAHLADYKRERLGVQKNGVWIGRYGPVEKAHILPKEKYKLNLLDDVREAFFDSEQGEVPLHRYFHHLNSSQAMCINLFYPMVQRKRLRSILRHIGISAPKDPAGTFEKESVREQVKSNQRRTSFDFHLAGHQGPEVFFEVKYTEDGFGKAEDDDEHRQKVEDVYRPLVRDSSYLTNKAKRPDQPFVDFFLTHYQLMRNLVHVDTNAHLVLLFPSWNEKVRRQAEHAREELLTPKGRDRLHIVFLEDMVDHLMKQSRQDRELSRHYAEFRRKYLPDLSVA